MLRLILTSSALLLGVALLVSGSGLLGSLLALRLSAMTDPASHFDNALVRFVAAAEVLRAAHLNR